MFRLGVCLCRMDLGSQISRCKTLNPKLKVSRSDLWFAAQGTRFPTIPLMGWVDFIL